MPGTLVEIGLNSPRMSAGAPGFRSNISCVAAPPKRNRQITLLALPCGWPGLRTASARNRSGRDKPPKTDRAPALRVSRRVRPSQHRRGLPSMVIIGLSPQEDDERGRYALI